MTIDDMERFQEIMTVLNEVFGDPNKPASDIKMRFYFRALSDLSIEQLNDAAIILANTKTIHTFPIPAEIRQAVEGNPTDKANAAFDKLLGAVRRIGPHQTVVFDDPAIHVFVKSYGGWEEICDKTVEEWKFMRNEFVKGYSGYSRRRLEAPPRLTGIHDATNRGLGIDHTIQAAIIGSPEKALEWTRASNRPALAGPSSNVIMLKKEEANV
jgi:hypothetical protein